LANGLLLSFFSILAARAGQAFERMLTYSSRFSALARVKGRGFTSGWKVAVKAATTYILYKIANLGVRSEREVRILEEIQ
jgi:hypothetical protein